MSGESWQYCSVCAEQFQPEEDSNKKPVLFRCVTCSDLSTGDRKEAQKRCLHICTKCHEKSGLYHASSHCWAKVFVSTVRGAYDFKKGQDWVNGIFDAATELAAPIPGVDTGGLATILDVAHYMACQICSQGIYGTRWISKSTKSSYCGSCYKTSPEFETEDVWFMRGSIFHNLPTTGPLIERPKLIDVAQQKNPDKGAPAPSSPAPAVGFGFGNPRPAVVRVTVPGENYSDYVAPEASPAAPAPILSAPQALPMSYVDESAESYEEEIAVNLKKASSYYGDEDEDEGAAASYQDDARPQVQAHISTTSLASSAYTNDAPVPQVAAGTYSDESSATTGSYTDDSGAGYYDDTSPQTPISRSISVTISTGPSKNQHPPPSGYSDDAPQDTSSGYSDETFPALSSTSARPSTIGVTISPGYSDNSQAQTSSGYSDDALKDASSGYSDKTLPAFSSTSARPSTVGVTISAGYSNDEPQSAAGYSDETSPSSSQPSADVFSKLKTISAAYSGSTTGYSDSSTGYADDVSISAPAGAYSDESSGYTDSVPSNQPVSSDRFQRLAQTQPSSALYSGSDSTIGYANDSSSSSGYADDAPGYGDVVVDPFAKLASKGPQPATYTDSDHPTGYSDTGSAAGYSQSESGYGYSNSGGDSASGGYSAAAIHVTPSQPKSASGDDSRDWNSEFQIRMARFSQVMKQDLPEATDILLSCRNLYSLSAEFIDIAQEIGRTIIEEVSIPAPAKSIKPVNVGGVAGGEKYVQRGIFFKFAIDAFGVYGGDEFAQKAAGHELAGLKAYYNCRIEGLNTPFMLLMDYRGYRLIATTKLPIGAGSLIYGSADGGITIHKDDDTMNQMMEKAAQIINIKAHVVGMRNQTATLFAPTDIEGHIGTDGRYYVLDTARICPPEPIHKSFTAVIVSPENPLPASLPQFRLWDRPKGTIKTTGEFWAPWPALREVGLTTERWMDQIYAHLGVNNSGNNIVSSEEFGEGLLYHLKSDHSADTVNLPGRSPTSRAVNVRASNLVKKVIHGPALLVLRGRKGAQLFNLLRYETVKRSTSPLSSDAFTPFGKHLRDTHNDEVENCFYNILSETIPSFLQTNRLFPHATGALQAIQQAGINTRMIGFLRSSITESSPNATLLKAWLLNEMIVRVTKNYLRSKLRRATLKLRPIEPIIIKRFNLLLGASALSTNFWATEMKAQIVNKFGRNGQALTPTEMQVDVDLRKSINKLGLFQSLQSKIGVVFTEDANGRFQVDPRLFDVPAPLKEKDLDKLVVTKKSLLQPDLDQLIIRTASAKNGDNPEQLLETLGTYLPDAQSHPAIALQRLFITEKLMIELNEALGNRFYQNIMYTSNVNSTFATTISESDPDYLAKSRSSQINDKADAFAQEINVKLLEFLRESPQYGEILSHLEVLRHWVEATPYCPLEITAKLFYLRGFLAIIHRLWTTAEAYLRTSYDCITRVSTVPGISQVSNYQNGYVVVDNDRPFSLLILDKLVIVMLAQNRSGEALAFSEKFVEQFAVSSFPGKLSDLRPLFGSLPPLAFATYRTHRHFRNHVRTVLQPLEEKLLKDTVANRKELDAWVSRVSLTNFDELSGFFMAPGVLQHYLDAAAYSQVSYFPHMFNDGAFWQAQPKERTENHLDQVIFMPPLLTPGVRDIQVTFSIHKNRLLYSKPPHKMILLQNITYADLFKKPDYKYIVPKDQIVASIELPDVVETPRGTVVFRGVDLKVGPYLAFVINGDFDLVGNSSNLASQPMQVIPHSATKNIIMSYDRYANYWGRLTPFASHEITSFAVFDSDRNNHDGKNSPALVYALDERGKVWKTDCHNYSEAPLALVRERGEKWEAPLWSVANDLFAWKVTSISVSATHTLILTDNGEVLSMGENKHGALGHGDTVAQSDPRLVRRIKGKSISKILAGEDRSAAIDEFGGLYQWGLHFTSLPELHPFFSGKSKSANGQKIGISKVVFQAYRPPSTYAHSGNDFFKNKPIGYISTEGQAFIWCGSSSLFPAAEEFKPEQITAPSDPIIDMAIGTDAIAFLTSRGEVWTAGSNNDGELGTGIGAQKCEMPRAAFRKDIPYSCAMKVNHLNSHFIVRLDASMETFYALSDQAELFSWGGGISWVPQVDVALQGLKVKSFACGLRGMIVTTDQGMTLPLEHHPLSVADQTADLYGSSSTTMTTPGGPNDSTGEDIPKAPGQAAITRISGTAFECSVENQEPAPDFLLHLTIPKTELGDSYMLRITKPGQNEAVSDQCYDIPLNLSDRWQVTVEASYSASKWGPPPHYVDRNPPFGPGRYQALIIIKEDEQVTIKHRSETFTVRPSSVKYTLTGTPVMPKPRETMTFQVSPAPKTQIGQYIVIRNKLDNSFAGLVSIDKPNPTHENYIAGHFVASWEYTMNPQEEPLERYATLEYEVGEPLADRPQLELEVFPRGPYYVGQQVVLEWNYVKNPPPAGSQFFGGLYVADHKGMTAVMQGGYVNLADAKGTSTITLPPQKGTYEFRAWQVVPSSGMVLMKALILAAPLDSAPAPEPEPAPSSQVEPSESDLDDTKETVIIPATMLRSSVLTFADWESFFVSCGIDKGSGAVYTKLISAASIPISKVHLLDGGILTALKITHVNHLILINEKVQAIRQSIANVELEKRLLALIPTIAPSLD